MIALEMLGYTDKRLGAQKYPPGWIPASIRTPGTS